MLTTTIALLASAAITTRAADAATSLAHFQFQAPPQRVFDSRDVNGPVTNVDITMPVSADRYVVQTILLSVQESSWLYFHPCGQPVDRTDAAANHSEYGIDQANLAPLDAGECMTLVGYADVIVDLVGIEGAAGGEAYVASAEPVELPVTARAGTTRFDVRGSGVPNSATGVALLVGIAAPDTAPASWNLVRCHDGSSLSQLVTAPAGGFADNLIVAPTDAGGDVCFRAFGATPENVTVSRVGHLSPTATPTALGPPYIGFIERQMPGFVAINPERLFDTRDAGTPVKAGSTYRYQVTGLPSGAEAVALNITVTETSSPGYVSAYPCDAAQLPEVSNVNWTQPGVTVPNHAIVALGSTKELCFHALSTTHLIADLAGYYLDGGGSGYEPVSPSRLVDTRALGAPVQAGDVYVHHSSHIPTGSTAAVLNVTVTEPEAPGYITVFPCGQERPTTSNVNFLAGETRPNAATVKVPADTRVCFYSSATTHLVVDLAGVFRPSSDVGLLAVEPFRSFDTRVDYGAAPLASDEVLALTFDDEDLRALAWNLTVTETEGPGFVAAYPCADGLPLVSNVNYTEAGQTLANFALVTPDFEGAVCLYALTGTHLIADQAGVFVPPIPWEVYYEGAPETSEVASLRTLSGAAADGR